MIKYQLDFKPKIYELEIPTDKQHENIKYILQQINEKNERTDLTDILFQNEKIELTSKIDDFDLDNIFIVHGPSSKFNLYSNLDIISMRSPVEITLNLNLDSQQICDEVKKIIPNEKSRFSPFTISIYVSGGIKLEKDLYSFLINYHPCNLNIYAVITPEVQLTDLKSRQSILDAYHLSKSSQINIAGLAEYFHLQGYKTMDLAFAICTIVNFPPIPLLFISLMNRGLTKEPFFHIISLLQTVFLGIYPHFNPETVFESTNYFCQYICSQYAPDNIIAKINGQFVYAPDFFTNTSNPFNQLWQSPSHLTLFSNNSDFHCFATNSIIRANPPCFTKSGLLLIQKQYQKNFFLNPITKDIFEKRIVSQFLQTLTAKDSRPDIKPANVKQTLVILVDRSEHMNTEELLNIEKKILQIYTDNSCRYRVMTLHSLMSFGAHNILVSKMATYDPQFASRLRSIQLRGKSDIFKAINDAVDYLNAYNWNETKLAFPNAQYRVVLVTAGYDDKQEISNTKEKSSFEETINNSNEDETGKTSPPKNYSKETPDVQPILESKEEQNTQSTPSPSNPTIKPKQQSTNNQQKQQSTKSQQKQQQTNTQTKQQSINTQSKEQLTNNQPKQQSTKSQPKQQSTKSQAKHQPINTQPKQQSTDSQPKHQPTNAHPKQQSTKSQTKQQSTKSQTKHQPTNTQPKQQSTKSQTKRQPTNTQPKQQSTDSPPKQQSTDSPPKQQSTDSPPKQQSTDSPSKQQSTDSPPKQQSETIKDSNKFNQSTNNSEKGSEAPKQDDKAKPDDLITYDEIKEKLLESNVILDAFVMKPDTPFIPTIAKLCHYTSGSCIFIDNELTATKTIPQEAFLNIDFRQTPVFGDDSRDNCDEEFPNKMKISGKKKSRLISVKQTLPKASNELTRRIIQEFRYIEKLNDPSFHVYMDETNIQQWRVFLKAPPGANLNEKWFYLLINFPENYPSKAPLFKFISIPYHININNEGSICLNYLSEEYNSSLTVAFMIVCILELLEAPNYNDPIDINRKKFYQENKNKFLEKVRESAQNGKDNYEDWLKVVQTK
ncbi:hypothetical protein M9Y10_009097 [Tritrichomonas musculus]|uniref:UBC core domain-containing protein n=1 Tax=Tritrichomonas musculus TaxID=1915356 RepID=A0ABR2J0Y6_9EUKA